MTGDLDKLPPHSLEAERGVLACILLDPALLTRARAQCGQDGAAFFDLRNRTVFLTLCAMQDAAIQIDTITLVARLKDYGHLDQVGGVAAIAALPDAAPSAANVAYYLDILREKLVARQLVQGCTNAAAAVMEFESTTETMVGKLEQLVDTLKRTARDPAKVGRRLKKPVEFGDDYWSAWFGERRDEPGAKLPPSAFGDFPWKIRGREMTFVLGEKGAGKTTLLSYITLFMLRHGMKAGVASMEMHPADSLKILASQLLGTTRLPDNEYGHHAARAAFDWLQPRVRFYDFLGIAPWRELIDELYEAVEDGFNLFQIDSCMRLGIPDDDYAQQGECATRLAQFCMETNSHVLLVNHLNKNEKSRGSQQWIDNSHNVVAILRNARRAEYLEDLERRERSGDLTVDQKLAEMAEMLKDRALKWSSKFELRNQRWPGAQQNASRYLLFERASLQLYDERWTNPKVNWLESWNEK